MKNIKLMFSFTIIIMCIFLIGCSEDEGTNTNNNNNSNNLTVSDTAFDIEVNYSDKETLTVSKDELDDYDDVIKLSNETVTITKSGEYVLEGSIDNGQIIVDVPDSDSKVVTLILNGISVTNENSSAIHIKNAKKVILTLVDGTSSIISDGENYESNSEDDKLNGCIYSKSDLVISGNGCLSVHANNNGIVSKDDLTITGGKIGVVAKNNALKGKDSIAILNGEIIIRSDGDGMKSDNDKDKEKGFILIEGGKIDIDAKEDGIQAATCMDIRGGEIVIYAGEDGIHAEDTLIIKGGTVNVEKSNEGVEATYIVVQDGEVNVTSSDDGINGAGITINDGDIYIHASGDGLDSNGHITVNGGVLTIDGPSDGRNGAIDYESGCIVNGGYILAVGNSNMAQMPTETTVNSVMIGLNSNVKGGETICIVDGNGENVIEFTGKKAFNNIVLCTEQLKTGETYVLEIDGKEECSFEINDKLTTVGNSK